MSDSDPIHISPRQQAILDYIQSHVQSHGWPPTLREMRDGLHISSTSVVAYHLKRLATIGLVKLTPHVARGIQLQEDVSHSHAVR
jgi:repressor LexA